MPAQLDSSLTSFKEHTVHMFIVMHQYNTSYSLYVKTYLTINLILILTEFHFQYEAGIFNQTTAGNSTHTPLYVLTHSYFLCNTLCLFTSLSLSFFFF